MLVEDNVRKDGVAPLVYSKIQLESAHEVEATSNN
jgi:hypothetical protein